MSVIIRLQNLPWSANAIDIRQYFHGLGIPEGGVHIVGGELGDAFIAFSTDEDARQAFLRNNGKIKEIQISLMLSSRTEMQRVIEQARSKSYAAFMQPQPVVPTLSVAPAAVPVQVPLPAAVPQIIPAAVPELKKEKDASRDKSDKRESRRRSRSKSKDRDRRDRSRDRERKDRRYRDRSRSKSRERKSSRRRDRSRSRNRSRSRERERRNSRDFRRKSEERNVISPFQRDQKKPDVWPNQMKPEIPQGFSQGIPDVPPQGFQPNSEPGKRIMGGPPHLNGFGGSAGPGGFPNNEMPRNVRESWPPNNPNYGGFPNRNNENFKQMDQFPGNDRFRRRNFNRYEIEGDTCVALEPFYGGYGDIRKFFHGMFISNKGIKFINDSVGKRTGIVYIQFSTKRTKEDALKMSGNILNGLEVVITHLEDLDFEEAIDRYTPAFGENNVNDRFKGHQGPKNFHHHEDIAEPELKEYACLTVEDLPTYVKEQDILHLFQMYPLVALNLVNRRRGGPIAYVKFGSKEEAKKAFEEKSHHVVGGKPVTVKPCTDEQFKEISEPQDVSLNSPKMEDIGSDCLSVSHLPLKTTDKDMADFFSDIGVIPTKIHLMSNHTGFTGEAYCEFLNSEEATRAAKKNGTILGSETISVLPISRQEMNEILSSAFPTPLEQGGSPPSRNTESISPNHFSGRNHPSENFGGPNRPFYNNRNNFKYDGPHRGHSRFQGHRGGSRMRFQSPPTDGGDMMPGCTVYLKNVPYKASTNDILNFFEGFSHTGQVSRRYNPNNTPSDEAKITFYDPDEASRAVDELQKMKIWDRAIYLRQE